MTFRLYTVLTGGTAFWTETQSVAVKSGQFSVVLGDVGTNLLASANFTGVTYIGVTVGTAAEMAPRQKFTSVAYALKSADSVPIGVIVMWSGAIATIPSGWALCDGTNGTPNLKDRFVVGAGNTYAVGAFAGNSTVNFNHSHSVNSHTHDGASHTHGVNLSTSQRTDNNDKSASSGSSAAWNTHIHQVTGNTAIPNESLTTTPATPGTDSQLSATQSMLPPYYALAYIMKIQ
jgi:hypothetical protein